MVLSSDNFLLVVSLACFLIIVTSGIIYTVWCSKCCRIPKADPDNEWVHRRVDAVPEGHAFYTTPWTMTTDQLAVQQVLAHPQLTRDFYYFPSASAQEENGSSGNESVVDETDGSGGDGVGAAGIDMDDDEMGIVSSADNDHNHDFAAVGVDAYIF